METFFTHPLTLATITVTITVFVIIVVHRICYRLSPKPVSGAFFTSRRRARTSLYYTLAPSLISLGVFACGVYVLAELWGLDAKLITAIAGLGTVVLTLSTRELASDVLSGFHLILKDVFRPGDIISTGMVTGRVKRIGLRSTVVKNTATGAIVYLSNSSVASLVENLTKETPRLSVSITVNSENTTVEEYKRIKKHISQTLEQIQSQLRVSLAAQHNTHIDTQEMPAISSVAPFIDPKLTIHSGDDSLHVSRLLKNSPHTIPSITSFVYQGLSEVGTDSITLDYLIEFSNPQARSQLLRLITTQLFLTLQTSVKIEEITDGAKTH